MIKNIDLFTKSGNVIQFLAKEFIQLKDGDKIRTVTELSEELDVARGTVQNAIKSLVKLNAISIQTKGHMGTFLVKKNLIKLLKYSGINILVGAMPLPHSKSFEGLSTGIIDSLEKKLKISVNMSYVRGSRVRFDLLQKNRFDFIISSKSAALEYMKDNSNIKIIREFGESSFISKHLLIYIDENFEKIKDGTKIGIDPTSIDQIKLTEKIVQNKKVEYVNIEHSDVIESLKNKKIDCAIWNGDEPKIKYGNVFFKDLEEEIEGNSTAILAVNSSRNEIVQILDKYVAPKSILEIQKKVQNSELKPKF